MKKIIVVALLAALLFSLCGCAADTADKPGYASEKQLLDAVVSMQYSSRMVTKEEFGKLTADGWWAKVASQGLDAVYAQWTASKEMWVGKTKQQFGDDYEVVYSILKREEVSAEKVKQQSGWDEKQTSIFGTDSPSFSRVELRVSIAGYEDQTQELFYLTLINANNRWYLYM